MPYTEIEPTLIAMRQSLGDVLSEAELVLKAELVVTINRLKKESGAVILGHNYMEAALYHFVADYRGDSLELCHRARETEAQTIVFCGVEFMAETAKVINPSRKVLLPSKKAGCSLAGSITAADIRKLRVQYPGVPVVAYINTYADVKAEIDICCTSGNAVKVVNSLKSDTIIFVPDEYLAKNVAKETGKTVIFPDFSGKSPENLHQAFIGWHGKCEVNDRFTPGDITAAREQYPDVIVLAHPECPPEVVAAADFSGSTSAMLKYVKEHPGSRYLLLTECAMADNIAAENKQSEMLRLCSVRCPHMAQITLEDTRDALLYDQFEIKLDSDLIQRAKHSIDRMLAIQ